jgi:hypothetical protein
MTKSGVAVTTGEGVGLGLAVRVRVGVGKEVAVGGGGGFPQPVMIRPIKIIYKNFIKVCLPYILLIKVGKYF